jgi:hypothetical protein
MVNIEVVVQVLAKKIRQMPGLEFDTSPAALSQSVGRLKDIAVSDNLTIARMTCLRYVLDRIL